MLSILMQPVMLEQNQDDGNWHNPGNKKTSMAIEPEQRRLLFKLLFCKRVHLSAPCKDSRKEPASEAAKSL